MGLLNSKQIADLQAQIAALNGTVATLTSERDAGALRITELTEANALCQTQYTADQAEIARLSQALTAEQESRETAISAQVTARLAAAGAAPIARDPAVTEATGGTLAEQCAAITDKAEQDKFYAAHRDAILAGF